MIFQGHDDDYDYGFDLRFERCWMEDFCAGEQEKTERDRTVCGTSNTVQAGTSAFLASLL